MVSIQIVRCLEKKISRVGDDSDTHRRLTLMRQGKIQNRTIVKLRRKKITSACNASPSSLLPFPIVTSRASRGKFDQGTGGGHYTLVADLATFFFS